MADKREIPVEDINLVNDQVAQLRILLEHKENPQNASVWRGAILQELSYYGLSEAGPAAFPLGPPTWVITSKGEEWLVLYDESVCQGYPEHDWRFFDEADDEVTYHCRRCDAETTSKDEG